MQEYKLYIDGKFCDAEGGKTADSTNPATEEPWARIARASRADTQRAIAAARTAFDEGPWPRMSQAERAKILNQIANPAPPMPSGLSRQALAERMEAIFAAARAEAVP